MYFSSLKYDNFHSFHLFHIHRATSHGTFFVYRFPDLIGVTPPFIQLKSNNSVLYRILKQVIFNDRTMYPFYHFTLSFQTLNKNIPAYRYRDLIMLVSR